MDSPISKRLRIVCLILIILMGGVFILGSLHSSGVSHRESVRSYGVTDWEDAERFNEEAIKAKDPSICGKLKLSGWGDMTEGTIQSLCYDHYAAAHPDEDMCPIGSESCVEVRALTLNNASLCLSLPVNGGQAVCVIRVASKSHDPKICNIIKAPTALNICKQTLLNDAAHSRYPKAT